jgi:rhomboid protease GluP
MSNIIHSIQKYVKNCPLTAGIFVVNTLMFLLTLATGGFGTDNLLRLGALVPILVKTGGEYYRILTSMFLHGNVIHFLSNMVALYFLGTAMERCLGGIRYLALYFLTGIGCGLAIVLFGNPLDLTIGASGALYGIMAGMLFITFRNRNWFTPASVRSIRQTTLLNFFITFLIPNISIIGHVTGFVLGLLASFFLVPAIPHFVRFRSKAHPVETPPGGDVPPAA